MTPTNPLSPDKDHSSINTIFPWFLGRPYNMDPTVPYQWMQALNKLSGLWGVLNLLFYVCILPPCFKQKNVCGGGGVEGGYG